jgi:hypothetical protein
VAVVLSWVQSAGAAGSGERAEADGEGAVAGDDVAGGVQGFADEGAGFVAGAGVAAVQGAGEAEAARRLDRYLRVRAKHEQAHRRGLWLGTGGRGPLTGNGIYQMVKRRGEQAGVAVSPHRFRHHFSHTWLDRGGAEGDLMELNGWSSPQMLHRYGGSVRGARARRHYDLIMNG